MVQGALIGLITVIVLAILNKKTARPVSSGDDGTFLLKALKLYLYLSFGLYAGAVIFMFGAYSTYIEEDNLILSLLCFCFGLFLFFGGIYCFLFHKNYQVIYSDNGLEVTSYRKKVTFLRWSEIKSGRYNPFSSCLKIKSNKGPETINIHEHTKGLKQFMIVFIEKTGITLKQTKMPIKLD